MKTKPSPNQLELDLVHACLGMVPTKKNLLLAERAFRRAPEVSAEEVYRLAVRLSYHDLTYDETRYPLDRELEEAKILNGREWPFPQKIWLRRAKQNRRKLAKLILLGKKLLT